jgi:hypothetical protein
MPEASPKETLQVFWKTIQTNDFAQTSLLLAEAYVLRYPQSGETFRGREAFVRLNTEYPANGLWRFSVNRLVADENSVVSDVDVTDGVVSARVLTFSTVENGLITEQLEFWPEPFEIPEWRRGWTKRD